MHAIRDAGGAQRGGKYIGLSVSAIQHRGIAWMFEQAAVDECADLVSSQLGLGLAVFGHHQARQRSGRIVGDQSRRLLEQVAERVGELNQMRGRTVIVDQGDYHGAGVQAVEVEQKGRIGSEPAKNALKWIASNCQISVALGEQPHQGQLDWRQVLNLVDEHPAESRLQNVAYLVVLA